MKRYFTIAIFVFATVFAKAQFADTLQSLINQKGSFFFSATSRNSFITNYTADIFGFDIGVTFGKKLTMGGGYNALNSIISKKKVIGDSTVNEYLSFAYFNYFIEYTKPLTKHWKLYIIPFSIGLGGSSYQYTYKGVQKTEDSYTVVPFEPSVEIDYNFFKWLGLYTQVGYRLMLINNPTIPENFNSPTYSYGLFVLPIELYAAIFPKTKLAHMIDN